MTASTERVSVVPQWTFADRLRKARQVAGFTQREFADALEVSAGSYSQWESGNNGPRDIVAVVKRIELMTGVPSAWLLGIDEPQLPPPGMVRREGIEPPTR